MNPEFVFCRTRDAIIFACLFLAAACGSVLGPLTAAVPQRDYSPLPAPACNVNISALRVPNIDFQTQNAVIVALVSVKEVKPARWTTPDGRRPEHPCSSEDQNFIFTPALLQTEQVFKGAKAIQEARPGERPLLVAVPGGSVGPDSVTYAGEFYTLENGQRAIVFLTPMERDQSRQLPAWHLSDKYAVESALVNDYFHEVVPLGHVVDAIRKAVETSARGEANE